MARALRTLVALVLAVPIVLATASPCLACSCAPLDVAATLEDRDVVAFVGEVVAQRGAEGGTIQGMRVDGVFQGELGPEVALFAQIGQDVVNSCAILLPTDTRVAVIARPNPDGSYSTDVCSLVTEADLRAVVGPPRPPDPALTIAPPPRGATTVGEGPELPFWVVASLGAVAGVVLIGLGTRVAGRRDRRVRGETAGPPDAADATDAG
jgi:hypothetical protein